MASGSLGALVVSMAVDTAKFQGDLGRAAAIAERRMKNIRETSARALAAVSVAASAAGTALVAMTSRSLRDADDMLKLAKSVGTTVEQLSALRYAANLAGVTQEELGIGLKKLANTAVDASNGVKASEAAFRALGIQVKTSSGELKSTDQLVADIADAFSKAPDSITKTAIATDLFGKSGAKLIPLLNEGRAGLEKLAAEADKYGLIISTKAAKNAERFNDNLTRLKSILTGFGNLLAAELATPLANFSDKLVEGANGINSLKGAAETGADVIKGFAATMILLGAAVAQAGKNLGALAAAYAAFFTGEFQRSFEIIRGRFADGQREIAEAVELIKALFSEAGEDVAAKAPQIADQLSLPITKTAENWREKVREIVEMERFMASIGHVPFDLTDVETTQARTADPGLARMLNEQAEGAQKVLNELFKSVNDDFENTSRQLSTYAEQAARNIQSHFADFLFDPFDKGINGMLKGFVDVLRRMIAEAAAARILEGLEGKMTGFLGGLFGGIGSLFGGGSKLSGGGASGNIPGFAAGGFMPPGSWGIVGEHGPELRFAGNQGATIVPFEKARGVVSKTVHVAPVFAPVIHIDSRTDSAAVRQDTDRIIREAFMEYQAFFRDQVSRGAFAT